MVALLRPQLGSSNSTTGAPEPSGLRLVVDNTADALQPSDRFGGRIGAARSADRDARPESVAVSAMRAATADRATIVAVLAAGLLLVAGLLFVRLSQGSPAADSWVGLQQSQVGGASAAGEGSVGGASAVGEVPAISVGDRLLVAEPGDSMWSIAQRLAPDSDPRPVVAALIEANGGDSVRIGQQIVIPQQLLD